MEKSNPDLRGLLPDGVGELGRQLRPHGLLRPRLAAELVDRAGLGGDQRGEALGYDVDDPLVIGESLR